MLGEIALARVRRTFNLPVKPALATLNVTDRCNCRCLMCDVHAREAGSELSEREWAALFRDPVMSRLRVVRITGGEPFLRDDLCGIFLAAAGNAPGRVVQVTTNGSLPGRVRDFLDLTRRSNAEVKLQISLDALGKKHDKTRGVDGLFERVMETAEIAAGRARRGLSVGINQTVIEANMDEIEAVGRFARERGFGHNVILGAKYFEGAGRFDAGGGRLPFEPHAPLPREALEGFYRLTSRLRREERPRRVRSGAWSAWLRDVSDEYLAEGGANRLLRGTNSPMPPCTAMFNHFRALPGGGITACSVFRSEPAGNLREGTMGEIWNSPGARRLRSKVRSCTGCWIECDVTPSAFFSGDVALWFLKKLFSDPGFAGAYVHPRWILRAIRGG
ncbi:MAG: radical SAM protein [bacterium]